MDIIKSIQESAMGLRMGFASITEKFGGVIGDSAKYGTAIVGPSYQAAQQRFAAVKVGGVSAQAPGAPAPVGVRYRPATPAPSPLTPPPLGEGRVGVPATDGYDPGTPATVVETIQKSIGESAAGWRMGYAHITGKAKAGISHVGTKVSESFGNVGDWFKSAKWQMLLPIIILAFIAVMVAVGYSGLGAPAARVAEREYARRR